MEIARKVNLIHVLLELLTMPDVPTLLQLMRLLHACFWDIRYAGEETVSSRMPVEQSVLQEDETRNISKCEVATTHSEFDVNPSFKLTLDEKAQDSCSYVANLKQLKHADNLCEKKCVKHDPSDGVSHLRSCAVDLKLSGLNSFALRESCHKDISQTVADQVGCESENVSDRSKDRQLQLNEAVNEKSEVVSLWLQELCDVSKWLPSISFILGSSTNGKFICLLSVC
jgi:hypothetical protein